MKPENTKPSLETLLQSKKLDQPSEIFWNDFQDQVKGRALASLSQKTLPQRCTRYMCVALPVVIIALIGVNLSSYLSMMTLWKMRLKRLPSLLHLNLTKIWLSSKNLNRKKL